MIHPQSQALERKIAILTRLTEISAALNSTLKVKPLLHQIMEAAAEIVEAEAASVLLWDTKANELRFAATTTGSQSLVGTHVPLESIAGQVMRENRVVVVEDVQRDSHHYTQIDKNHAFQTRSILAVPMHSKNRLIGVLEAVNKRQLPWTEDDSSYLTILASQAAVALEGVQLVTALQKANEELSRVDKLKSDFIAIASHELRTPLGVILGYASFLQESDDSEVRDHASKVVGSAMQLRRLIEDLTNLRFFEQNAADLDLESIDLDSFLRELLHDVNSIVEAKRHRLHYIPPPSGTRVMIDRIRMGMAVTSVLNNAVSFTPDFGLVEVQTQIHGGEVRLSISDNGIGLASEQLERIFDRFYQVEDHMTRSKGGMGIGLSIARALVEAHKGRIWATSAGLNQGATFIITMPLAQGRAS